MRSLWSAIPFIGSLIVLFSAWYFVTQQGWINKLFLPHPRVLGETFFYFLQQKTFFLDVGITIWRVLTAFLLSLGVGFLLAVVIMGQKWFARISTPYLDFFRYIPVPALAPLTILFFGIDETAKIALLFLGTVFQLVLLFVEDLRRVPKEYLDLGFSLGYSRVRNGMVRVRAALPDMYHNSRVSLGLCWSYVLIAELVAADRGIGHLIKEAQRLSHTPEVYAGIITIGVIGLCSDLLLKHLYPRFFPYRFSEER